MSDQPKRPTAREFSREVLNVFDDYVHGAIDRRAFLERAAVYAGSATAATGLLAVLSPDFAYARKVAPDDARIAVSRVDIPSPSGYGTIKAYVAKPQGATPRSKKPVVLVVHENDGFIAVAPDALTPLGGYPGDEDKARALFPQLDQTKTRADFLAAAAWAQALPDGNGKLGAVGFCYGGGVVNFLATQLPALRAAAPFYGAPPPLDAVRAIKAEMLVQHAGNDARLVGTWPDYEKALKAAGVKYQGFVYPGVEHGFNNDTTPRYDEKAAGLAWQRTIEFVLRAQGGDGFRRDLRIQSHLFKEIARR